MHCMLCCVHGCRCDTIQRSPDQQVVQMTVSRPANLSRQAWVVDPEYFWFMEPHCSCGQVTAALPSHMVLASL